MNRPPTSNSEPGRVGSRAGRVLRPSTIDTGTIVPRSRTTQTVATRAYEAEGTDRPSSRSIRSTLHASEIPGRRWPTCSVPRWGSSILDRSDRGPSDRTTETSWGRSTSDTNGWVSRHTRQRAIPRAAEPGRTRGSHFRIRCGVRPPQFSHWRTAAPTGGGRLRSGSSASTGAVGACEGSVGSGTAHVRNDTIKRSTEAGPRERSRQREDLIPGASLATPVEIALVGSGVLPIPPTRYGSISRAIWELAEALRGLGHSVRIVNVVRRGVQWDQFPFAASLDRLLGDQPTDVIHAHLGVPAFRLRMLGLPYVYTTHNPAWFFPDRSLYRWVFWFDRWATLGSVTTVTETELVADAVRAYAGDRSRGEVRVIPHGIDLARFSEAPGPGDGQVAIGIGAIRRVKRWDLAARALAGTGIRLRIAGPVQDLEYAQEVRRSGPVELLGEVSQADLVAEIHRAGFVLHPSESETFGLSVGEAAACGRAVVTSATVRSIVEDGVTGFVAPAESAGLPALEAFFRERAQQLAGDEPLRRRMGATGRRLAEEKFAWPKVAQAHVALYREALAQVGPAIPG